MRRTMELIVAMSAALLGLAADAAWGQTSREEQLKAAYLLNFVKFVEWPPAPAGEAVQLCFLGASGTYKAITAAGLEGKRIGNRPLTAREVPAVNDAAGCHMLYADAQKSPELHLAPHEPRPPMLTVSDAKEFAKNGGVIELFPENNRLRFIINVDNARRAGLRIGSGLLQLATAVQQGDGK